MADILTKPTKHALWLAEHYQVTRKDMPLSLLNLPNNNYRLKGLPQLGTLTEVKTSWSDESQLPPKPRIRFKVVGRLSVTTAYQVVKRACYHIPQIDREDMVQECMLELVQHHTKITTQARAYAYCSIKIRRYWQHIHEQSHDVAYAHARHDLLASLPLEQAQLAKRRLRGKTLDQVDQAKLNKYRRIVSWLLNPKVTSLSTQLDDGDGNTIELGDTIPDTLRFEHQIEFKSFLRMPRQVKRAAQNKLNGVRLTNKEKQVLSAYAHKIFD